MCLYIFKDNAFGIISKKTSKTFYVTFYNFEFYIQVCDPF